MELTFVRKYKLNTKFKEDEKGVHMCREYTDKNGDPVRIIHKDLVIHLGTRNYTNVYLMQDKDNEQGIWENRKTIMGRANENLFVDSDGNNVDKLVANDIVDDESKPAIDRVTGELMKDDDGNQIYAKKYQLKEGYSNKADYFENNVGHPVIFPVIESQMEKRFG